ncbi:MYG1 protein [Cordyceps militaris CM01]|uniref:MYG1 protein n=1 Tax=Cordyceps militaris (strain CM01) TaxID=983644 RepID=G3J4L3_CORMM|nr:MYG1 protein [Cordyceps militaris CM01]EGX95883.1 MYG1 protein [Cordyceps militaris CM01]
MLRPLLFRRALTTTTTLGTMAAESAAKRLKTDGGSSSLLIGTHNGHFHADEALAVHMLRRLPAYANSTLVRTRDPAVLATCHTVVDVGGEYDAARHRYDHHQRGFATTFPDRPTKLSSAGLVFLHFGRAIIAQRLAGAGASATEDDAQVRLLHAKIYQSFVEALDAHDNGIAVYDPAAVAAAGLAKRFSDGGFGLGAMVGRLNPSWNEPAAADPAEAQRREDARFLTASQRIGEEFDREVDYYASAWLPARAVVQDAFARRAEHDPDGRVLVLDGQSVPWKDHLYTLEQDEGRSSVLYVLYQEKPEPGAKWRIQCVPESKDSFVSRKPLPEAWRGFRDAELDAIAGVEGCVFVHAAGFIGGNATFDGAKVMVAKALAA